MSNDETLIELRPVTTLASAAATVGREQLAESQADCNGFVQSRSVRRRHG
jgi:hypothetical protein